MYFLLGIQRILQRIPFYIIFGENPYGDNIESYLNMDSYTIQSHSLHNRIDIECCSFQKNQLSGYAIPRALRNIFWPRDLSMCFLHIFLLPSHSQEVLPGDFLCPSPYLPDPTVSSFTPTVLDLHCFI